MLIYRIERCAEAGDPNCFYYIEYRREGRVIAMYKITHYKVHDNKGAHYKTTTDLLNA
ncbi:MAG: hypothetical protein MJ093_02905 [Saccharofermentans sp.]|nr:hypothetical protein [Saccharofermentans sp.]